MKHFSLQSGSSTIGLIAATGLFVGLMVYTTQFAFVKQENNLDKQVASAESEQATTLSTLIAPVMGIFSSETIQSKEADKAMLSDSAIKTPSKNETEITVSKGIVHAELPPSSSAYSDNSTTEAVSENSQLANSISNEKELPIKTMLVTPFMPDNLDRNRVNLANQLHANRYMYNQNSQYASGQYYGHSRGNGKGTGNGQGEFGFSISLKSRANMDANSDWDSGLNGRGAGYRHNTANYQQNVYANHNNQYQYRQY